jgi:hypothetical protein
MTAGIYDWTFEQGTTVSLTLVYKDANDVVVNLSSYSARMQIRPWKSSSTVLLEATTANGRVVITPEQGKIVVTFAAALTQIGDWKDAVYDLEIESSAGVVTRLLEGSVLNSRDVTR